MGSLVVNLIEYFGFKFILVCDLLCPKKSFFSLKIKVALIVLSGMTFSGGEFF